MRLIGIGIAVVWSLILVQTHRGPRFEAKTRVEVISVAFILCALLGVFASLAVAPTF